MFDYILTPFVYRRYLDYGVFDALRQMKRLIAQEVARKDLAENIKLGPGGIREIEFIVQAFQIVRGGRRPELRARSLLDGLAAPRRRSAVAGEHRRGARGGVPLSAHRREPHSSDERRADARAAGDDEERARLAYALHEPSWTALYERLRAPARDRRSGVPARGLGGGGRRPREEDPLAAAWQAGDVSAMLLAGTPLAGDEHALDLLKDLRHGGLYQRMDEVGRQRLAAAMVRTLTALAGRARRR